MIPHRGAMCLLDSVEYWTAEEIVARSASHLSPDNPLRRAGRLGMACGAEYAFQAAAAHGALIAGSLPQRRGYVASLRIDTIGAERLDDPAYGLLKIRAMLELNDPAGTIYRFVLHAQSGLLLLEGSGAIMFPPDP